MPARTGAEYLNGLRERRELWFRGEGVRDDARHPPTTGQPVSLAFIQPRSVDDLVRRRVVFKTR